MMEKLVIGLDSSTTGTKALAFDMQGNVIAQASEPIPLSSPQSNYYEQNPEDWWESTQKVLLSITNQIDANRIEALAISNQRETFVPLDKNGNPIRPAIIWLDERCKDEVRPFAEQIGMEKIHQITGKPVDYAPVVYRLAWMKNHEPELYTNIAIICDVSTYLTWKLTGQFKTSWASADPLGLYDMANKKWSAPILDTLVLKESQFPQTFQPGQIIGNISDEAAKQTGLSIKTNIVAGGGDGQAAGLGSNVLTSKRAYLNLGTAVVAGVFSKKYFADKAFRTMFSCSDSGYYFETSLRAGTFAIDWFIRNILKIDPRKNTAIYNELESEAQQIALGSEGLFYLPYLNGVMNPYWDIDARGSFIGLASSHTRGHMYRAILEGIAFEQMLALESVENVIGERIEELVTIGGGSKSNLWNQIIADITGKNLVFPQSTESSGLGVAIAASVGAGWYNSFEIAAQNMSKIKKVLKPNPNTSKKYYQYYQTYKKIYPALKVINSIT